MSGGQWLGIGWVPFPMHPSPPPFSPTTGIHGMCQNGLVLRARPAPPFGPGSPCTAPSAPPPPQGLALIFIPTGGGGGGAWTPSPPPPSAQVQLKTWVLGTFFGDGEKISRRLRRTHCLLIVLCVLCVPCLADYHDPTLVVSVFLLPSPTVAARKTQRRNRRAALF